MNRALVDPFALAQEYPERLTGKHRFGNACCVRFSPSGDYLAVGLVDGNVLVADAETWAVLREFDGHVAPVQSFAWSACGRYLLSAARDWNVILWDTGAPAGAPQKHRINLGAPVWGAAMHPREATRIVAARYEALPVAVDLATGEVTELPSAATKTFACIFSPDGKYILAGGGSGDVTVHDSATLELVHTERVAKGSVKYLGLPDVALAAGAQPGAPSAATAAADHLVVNAADRTIRVLALPDFSRPAAEWSFPLVNKFVDNINRRQYLAVTSSPSGEFLLAITQENLHNIYMWEAATGLLVRMYECPDEELLTVTFHPTRAAIVATGVDSGTLYVWTLDLPQNWSALAPDFVELNENEPYNEREDEFDIDDADLEAAIVPVQRQIDVFATEAPLRSFVIPFDL